MLAVICHDRLYSNMRLFLGPAGGIGFSQLPLAHLSVTNSPHACHAYCSLCSQKSNRLKDHAACAGDGETREPGARSAAKLALDSPFTD